MSETTQEERDRVRPVLEETVRIDQQREEQGLSRHGTALDCAPGFALKLIADADRLAKLEDGIRALADVCDVYDTDDVQIHPQWVTKRLRAILGEDGECQACAKERSGVISGGTPHTCLRDGE